MPSTKQTPVKTRTPWPPGTFCSIVYIIKRLLSLVDGVRCALAPSARDSLRVRSYVAVPARVDGVQAIAPAASDGLRESCNRCARVAMRACRNTDASWRLGKTSVLLR